MHLQSLAVLVPSILFFLWSPGLLLNQRPNVPKRTVVLLGLLTVLAVVDFVFGWKYGVQCQGRITQLPSASSTSRGWLSSGLLLFTGGVSRRSKAICFRTGFYSCGWLGTHFPTSANRRNTP